MLDSLKKAVFDANIELVRRGVVIYTWGNVSGIDESRENIVIKPSGVSYDDMKWEDMVVVSLSTGQVVEGLLNPSSDTPTHLEIYRAFPEIKGIAHTHSINAVSFAQAGMDIKALGTTHADYFYGDIPCARALTEEEVNGEYEVSTGKVIVEEIQKRGYEPLSIPGILVKNHGPFSWGDSPASAVFNGVVMEVVAEMAQKTLALNSGANLDKYVLDKHYNRKHGKNAYYGQKK